VRYVSDKYCGQNGSLIKIPEGGSFRDMVALKGKSDIEKDINKIISKLAEENELNGGQETSDLCLAVTLVYAVRSYCSPKNK
jgi:type I restriction enzyme M protein